MIQRTLLGQGSLGIQDLWQVHEWVLEDEPYSRDDAGKFYFEVPRPYTWLWTGFDQLFSIQIGSASYLAQFIPDYLGRRVRIYAELPAGWAEIDNGVLISCRVRSLTHCGYTG